MPRRLLLVGLSHLAHQGIQEYLFKLFYVGLVAIGIIKRIGVIGAAILQLFILGIQAVKHAMGTGPDFGRNLAGPTLGCQDIAGDFGIIFIAHILQELAIEAALDEAVIGAPVFFQGQAPGQAAFRVA